MARSRWAAATGTGARGDELKDKLGRCLEAGVGRDERVQSLLLKRGHDFDAVMGIGELLEDVDEGVGGDDGNAGLVLGVVWVGLECDIKLLFYVVDE